MNKKIPFILFITFLLWLLNQLFVFLPNLFFISLSLAVLLITLIIKNLIPKNSVKFWPLLIISPILFYLTASFYSAILTSQLWIQFIFLINAYFIFAYLKNIYYFYSFGAPEREIKLRRLLLSFSFLAMFGASAVLYSLPIFLNLSFWSIFVLLVVICFIIFGQLAIFLKTDYYKREVLFLGLDTLILSEFAGVFLLLPLSYNVRAFLLAIIFYNLILFNNWRREGRLTFNNLKWPLFSTALIIFVILFSARWR